MTTRILLADDHTLMRQGLASLLNSHEGLEVVAEAGDGLTAVRLARQFRPDIVIMDISMPGLNGIEATRRILRQPSPSTRIIALSMHADQRFVAQVLKAGAKGYLLKDCAFDELARAIRVVVAKQVYLSPAIAGSFIEDYLRKLSTTDGSAKSILTERECEVLQMLAEGNSTKQIAGRLGVSAKTIETHRRRIMDKLDLYTVAELTKYAIREGLTSPER